MHKGRGQGDGKGEGGNRVGVSMRIGSDGGRGADFEETRGMKEKILGLVGSMGGRGMDFFTL